MAFKFNVVQKPFMVHAKQPDGTQIIFSVVAESLERARLSLDESLEVLSIREVSADAG